MIALSQIKDFLGLRIVGMPADFFGIVRTLTGALHTMHWGATALALVMVTARAWPYRVFRWKP